MKAAEAVKILRKISRSPKMAKADRSVIHLLDITWKYMASMPEDREVRPESARLIMEMAKHFAIGSKRPFKAIDLVASACNIIIMREDPNLVKEVFALIDAGCTEGELTHVKFNSDQTRILFVLSSIGAIMLKDFIDKVDEFRKGRK